MLQQNLEKMTKLIIRYGLLTGLAVAALFLSVFFIFSDESHGDEGMLIGFATMFIGMLVIIPGVKKVRANRGDKPWHFGWAFLSAFGMAIIACMIYSFAWTMYIEFINPDWMSNFIDVQKNAMAAKGMEPIEIEAKMSEMKSWEEAYTSPIGVFGITLMEPSPIALLMSLIAATVWYRKP